MKVQRPDAKEQIEQDLALLEVFAEKVGHRPGLKQVIDMEAVFEHLSESLHRELDFRQEAGNMRRMTEVIAPFPRLRVPEVHGDFSTSRLLVMRDVAGGPIASAPEGTPRKEAARQLLESFYKQIMVDGFFHADPHPGNLMWQPEEELLYFLDLGMVGEVSAEMREQMMLLLMAFWQEDVGFLTDISLMLSGAIDRSDLDVDAFSEEIGALMAKNRGASLKDIQLGPVLQEMTEISLRHNVPLPASLTLTGKALAQMQLAAAQLDPELDPFDVAGKFLMRNVVTGMGSKLDLKAVFYQTQKMKVRAMRVIEAIERLIGARPGQKLEVNFRAASLETTIRRAGRRLALGLDGGCGDPGDVARGAFDARGRLGTGRLRRRGRPADPRADRRPDPSAGLTLVRDGLVELGLAAFRGDRRGRGGGRRAAALLHRSHHGLLQHERDHPHRQPDEPALDATQALRLLRSSAAGHAIDSAPASTGNRPSIVVPRPGLDVTVTWPSSAPTRSAIPCSPVPPVAAAGSNPRPSSETVKHNEWSRSAIDTEAEDAEAYFAMFCIASRHEKYTAASTSCGYRAIASAWTSTGRPDFLACASSAETRPLSARSGG